MVNIAFDALRTPYFALRIHHRGRGRPGSLALCSLFLLAFASPAALAAEPPAINPFKQAPALREDAQPGCLELSDGIVLVGQIYLTRDKRLMIYDEKKERQREVPLRAIKQIECRVKKEWMEKEWKFNELTQDEKLYTGRQYPAREYVHTITLTNGRTITGPLSAIVYIQPLVSTSGKIPVEHFLLHKRDKGNPGQKLKDLLYVKRIKLGKEAMEEGNKKKMENQNKNKTLAVERFEFVIFRHIPDPP
jgi:hypothetical protein